MPVIPSQIVHTKKKKSWHMVVNSDKYHTLKYDVISKNVPNVSLICLRD